MEDTDISELTTEQLLDLYKIVVDEYRFQVRINWERTRYFLTLSVGVTVAGFGLLRFAGENLWIVLAALIAFGSAAALALFGKSATEKGHLYYRKITRQKAEIERALQLGTIYIEGRSFNLALEHTEGMQRQRDKVSGGDVTEPDRPIRTGTVLHQAILAFRVLIVVNGVGVIGAIGAF